MAEIISSRPRHNSATSVVVLELQQETEPARIVRLALRSPEIATSSITTTVAAATTSDGETKAEVHIRWSEDVINNENLNRKSSKRCCIYHKSKKFGESDSDESDSDVEVAKRSEPKVGRPKNYQRFHA